MGSATLPPVNQELAFELAKLEGQLLAIKAQIDIVREFLAVPLSTVEKETQRE